MLIKRSLVKLKAVEIDCIRCQALTVSFTCKIYFIARPLLSGMGFHRSSDPTNGVKALKEDVS